MCVSRFHLVKMLVASKFIYMFNAIPIKTAARFSVGADKIILKFVWKSKSIRIAKKSFEEE